MILTVDVMGEEIRVDHLGRVFWEPLEVEHYYELILLLIILYLPFYASDKSEFLIKSIVIIIKV